MVSWKKFSLNLPLLTYCLKMVIKMIQEFARAKINLTLDILKRREDGYHEVEMLMQTVELADVVELSKISAGIKLQVFGGENIPADEKNLAWQAAAAVQNYCGENFCVGINLTKKIPQAAGLAGGSSDAAAVIRGMNKLFGLKLSVGELCEIGATVGSDVPFCIVGGTCLATGRGEILTKLPDFKKYFVVLLKPRGEISTAWAYKTFDEIPAEKISHPATIEIIKLLDFGEYEQAFAKFKNVLEPVALKKFPAITKYKEKMLDAGAKFSMMSGSGPTIFALAEDEVTAKKIASSVEGQGVQIFITKIF